MNVVNMLEYPPSPKFRYVQSESGREGLNGLEDFIPLFRRESTNSVRVQWSPPDPEFTEIYFYMYVVEFFQNAVESSDTFVSPLSLP